jgi:hypothetical protein
VSPDTDSDSNRFAETMNPDQAGKRRHREEWRAQAQRDGTPYHYDNQHSSGRLVTAAVPDLDQRQRRQGQRQPRRAAPPRDDQVWGVRKGLRGRLVQGIEHITGPGGRPSDARRPASRRTGPVPGARPNPVRGRPALTQIAGIAAPLGQKAELDPRCLGHQLQLNVEPV